MSFEHLEKARGEKRPELSQVMNPWKSNLVQAQWLFDQGRKGLMKQDEVGALLCEEDTEGNFLLLLSPLDDQKEAAIWNMEATSRIAPMLSADFIQWLIRQAVSMQGKWSKEDVGSIVCRENGNNELILATLDDETQKQVAEWNREATNRIAGFMNADFIQWLISQAEEGTWPKEDVGSIVCSKNRNNQLILATLDDETKKQVAEYNKAKTCSVVPLMDANFHQWLYQEAVEGRWDQSMVFEAVEELDDKANFSPSRKPGRNTLFYIPPGNLLFVKSCTATIPIMDFVGLDKS